MEYLMTYGWAILIIAVVLAALFSLGVFNSSGFTASAKAGACQVTRVGASGTQTISLTGECQPIPPQFVAQLNGQSSYITTPFMTSNMPAITVSVWFYLSNVNFGDNPRFASNGHTDTLTDQRGFQLMVNNGGSSGWFDVGSGTGNGIAPWSSYQLASKTWYFYAGTYNQTTGKVYAYINGNQIATGSFGGLINSNIPVVLGYNPVYSGDYVDGYMSNVQIYNTSLSQSEITALYLEGIGGVPVRPQNIAAWWPLNGNENDYGGNNYNGQPVGLTFTSMWMSGYTQP